MDGFLKPLPGRQIHLEGSKTVGEVKRVHHRATLVRIGARFSDVHSASGQSARHRSEQKRAVQGDQRQFVPMTAAFERQLNPVMPQAVGHLEVPQDLVHRMRAEIAPRKTFQKGLELLPGGGS
jgi:hypothetical protein